MELFLNIVWVLVAAGILGTWRTRWVHQRERTLRHSLQEWAAVSVALVLLFFAVSMTDDLHAELVLSEECSASRRSSFSPSSTHPLLQSEVVPRASCPAIVAHVSWVAPLVALENLEPLVVRSISDIQSNRHSGRAPPFSSL